VGIEQKEAEPEFGGRDYTVVLGGGYCKNLITRTTECPKLLKPTSF
jgi:hypothetical protein